ncbi:MAG: ABC transporter permease [Bacteroidia bacterium]|nr:ABC transporter permease [Bacteroidia bacterium]MCZ2277337.1 ABC transporter permease [Bacteroidia bacterium]
MGKITLIIQREYLTRIRKKSFIIMTILGPLLMGGIIALSVYLTLKTQDTVSIVQVIDETNSIYSQLPQTQSIHYVKDTLPVAIAREIFNAEKYYGILYIPKTTFTRPDSITLFTAKQPSPAVVTVIEKNLENLIEEDKFKNAGISKATLDSLKTKISLVQKSVATDTSEKEFSAEITAGAGFFAGMLIYFFIFLYGIQVMRGVMEEKSNRIMELIISSVKPFQLMMGKIIGIALVGLTQFLLWVVLTLAIVSMVSSWITGDGGSTALIEKVQTPVELPLDTSAEQVVSQEMLQSSGFMKALGSLNITKILFAFVFYFLGGYLLYSALFAAIGGAVDNDTDTQQFMLPITIPLILAYIVAVSVMTNPESSIGYWFSIIPFTSPIVMMVRMPFDPPLIDLVISMVLLVAGFIFTTWIAGRIYRTGILMYGKKITWKEIGKWLFYKN